MSSSSSSSSGTSTSSSSLSSGVSSTLLQFLSSLYSHYQSLHGQEGGSNSNSSIIPINSFDNLKDGVIFCDILHWLEPSFFDSDTVSRTNLDDASIRSSNLSSICFGLESFFEDSMGKTMNLDSIAKEDNVVKLSELILVLGIHSQKKEDVVNVIMTLTDDQQTQLMNVINDTLHANQVHAPPPAQPAPAQRVPSERKERMSDADDPLDRYTAEHRDSEFIDRHVSSSSLDLSHSVKSPVSGSSDRVKKLEDQISELEIEKSYLTQQIDHANREIRDLKKTNADLTVKVEELTSKASKAVSEAVSEALANVEKQNSESRKSEQTKAQREFQSLENRLTEYQQQLKRSQESIQTLQREKLSALEQIESQKAELISSKDELQLSSHKLEQMSQLEAKLFRLQQRLEERSDMKIQVEKTEEQAQRYMSKIVELEQKLQEITPLKAQIQRQKDTIVNLQSQIVDLKGETEQAKTECIDLKSQVSLAREESKAVNDALKAMKSERDTAQARLKEFTGSNSLSSSTSAPSASMVHDLKEKITRLELENLQLKAAHSSMSSSSEINELKSELEIAREMANNNEQRYLNAQKKIAQLEGQLRASANAAPPSNANASAAELEAKANEIEQLRKELIEAQQNMVVLKQQQMEKRASIGSPAAAVSAGSEPQNQQTNAELVSKMENLLVRNKKLELYVKAAQKMKTQLNETTAKLTAALEADKQSNEIISGLKNELFNKEKELKEKEKIRQDETHATNRERRLLSAAFYSLGIEYHTALINNKALPRGPYTNTNQSATPADHRQSKSWISQQRGKVGDG